MLNRDKFETSPDPNQARILFDTPASKAVLSRQLCFIVAILNPILELEFFFLPHVPIIAEQSVLSRNAQQKVEKHRNLESMSRLMAK